MVFMPELTVKMGQIRPSTTPRVVLSRMVMAGGCGGCKAQVSPATSFFFLGLGFSFLRFESNRLFLLLNSLP